MDGALPASSSPEEVPRHPQRTDLARLCAELNRREARYVVVGGFAIIETGYIRLTSDIDLLMDTSLENEARVFDALRTLKDKAVNELEPGDVEKFNVVRVADEILVDLMKSGCGVDYNHAIKDAKWREIEGVKIPFASPETLWKMKQTHREKDIPDRLFLRKLLQSEGKIVEPEPHVVQWLKSLFNK